MNAGNYYSSIKDAVAYGFNEYINEEGFNVCQASAKILEEDWREVNYSTFTKLSYLLNIAIESLKRGEIADFIYEKMSDNILNDYESISEEEIELYKKDREKFKQLKAFMEYRIVENTFATKAGVEYYLKMK